jgi:hypothetical protein
MTAGVAKTVPLQTRIAAVKPARPIIVIFLLECPLSCRIAYSRNYTVERDSSTDMLDNGVLSVISGFMQAGK